MLNKNKVAKFQAVFWKAERLINPQCSFNREQIKMFKELQGLGFSRGCYAYSEATVFFTSVWCSPQIFLYKSQNLGFEFYSHNEA